MSSGPGPEPLELWRSVYRAFDPRRPLSPAEVEDLYVEIPRSASSQILQDIELADDPRRGIFVVCGSRGSGKTTEIANISRRLSSRFRCIRVDLENTLPEPVSTPGLLLVLGVFALRALEDLPSARSAIGPLRDGLEEAIGGLGDEVSREVDLGRLVAGAATTAAALSPEPTGQALAMAAAAFAGSTRLAWSPAVGRAALAAPDPAQERLLAAVNAVLEKVEQFSRRPVLVLADGLDKLVRLQDVVQVLSRPRLLAELRCQMVITGPINLLHNAEFAALRQSVVPVPLYNLAVRSPANPDEQEGSGVAFLLELFEKRRRFHKLPDLAPEPVIRELARYSAGSIRDFVDLVRGAAREAAARKDIQLTAVDAREAVRGFRHLLEFSLTSESVRQLQAVLRTRRPTGDPHCEELLFNNYVLCYPDGDLWYRPHEALIEWINNAEWERRP